MLKRTLSPLPAHVYPPDPWRLVEARWPEHHAARAETVLALGNGYLGVRGTFDEGRPAHSPGTFINGFHETWPILHAEAAYGLARTGQTMVEAPDATVLALSVDDEPLSLHHARMRTYERVLDMRTGVLARDLVWSTPAGKHVHVRTTRLVSLEHRHLLAIRYEVTLLDHPAAVSVTSRVVNRQDGCGPEREHDVDPRLGRRLTGRVLLPQMHAREGTRQLLAYRTANSGMTLAVAVDHVIEAPGDYQVAVTVEADCGELVLSAEAEPGAPLRITKYVSYQTSHEAPAAELAARCGRTLDRAVMTGFDTLLEAQRLHLDRFWDRADVQVNAEHDGQAVQQAVRWNLFQVAQASWRAEGAGIPAKGVTGDAYDGHYFWDSEVYVLPFLAYTQPRIARNLLRFRYSMLGSARARARELSQRGALFPWRTINGEEASAYYEAGTAQYHINADIAHAIWQYVTIRGDWAFLAELGAEMLVETARLWADLGFYGTDGSFHIHGVTGPDEYTTLVNDNAYTNLVARRNLEYAVEAVRILEEDYPAAFAALVQDVALGTEEVEDWRRAARAMYVPYDRERGIHPQDAAFLSREVWDLDRTPQEEFPLLLHYHPLVIYRHQVLKQADIVLAMFLLHEEFSAEQKARNFDYYDPLTTGDSSLSACVQSIIANEIGRDEEAAEYFRYALYMDLGDVAGNASDGVHVASAAGVWSCLVFGFGGVRETRHGLELHPHLPAGWRELTFPLRYQGRQLRIRITQDEERISLQEGEALRLGVRGTTYLLRQGEDLVTNP